MKKSVCSENNKYFELKTPKIWKCTKIKIDGDLISDQSVEKCDYAFTVHDEHDNKNAILYVELKGHDLEKAIAQLESTINLLKDHFVDYKDKQAHAQQFPV